MLEKSIPEIEKEEDGPVSRPAPRYAVEEIKTEREEARKDADSAHARNRDTWVTVSGMVLILILIFLYKCTVKTPPPNENTASLFLNLLESVIMLIIGYIFGTKITR
jgi:hypothetical protein